MGLIPECSAVILLQTCEATNSLGDVRFLELQKQQSDQEQMLTDDYGLRRY